jgi:NADPH:quinone reductase
MKAIRVHAHGGPEVLRLEDVSDPRPGPGPALIRMESKRTVLDAAALRSG